MGALVGYPTGEACLKHLTAALSASWLIYELVITSPALLPLLFFIIRREALNFRVHAGWVGLWGRVPAQGFPEVHCLGCYVIIGSLRVMVVTGS